MTLADCFFGLGVNNAAFQKVFPEGKILWGSEIKNSKYGKYLDDLSKKNYPNKKNLGNILFIRESPHVKIIAGGFPCQDISITNPNFLLKKDGCGTSGKKSSLYGEMLRIVVESDIPIIHFENVANICKIGLNNVLHDLYELGFDVQYKTYYLYEFGSQHGRRRTYIIAYKNFKTMNSIFNEDFEDFMNKYNFEVPIITYDQENLTFTHNNITYPLLVEKTTESTYRNKALGNSVHMFAATYAQDAIYRLSNKKTSPINVKYIGNVNNFYNDKRSYIAMPNCAIMTNGEIYETPTPPKRSFTPSDKYLFSIPTPLHVITSSWDDVFCLAKYDSKERIHIFKTSKFNLDPNIFFKSWYLKNNGVDKIVDIYDFRKNMKPNLPEIIVNPILVELQMGFDINYTKL